MKTKNTHKQTHKYFRCNRSIDIHKHISVVRFQRGISRMTFYMNHMTVSSISVALVPMNYIYSISSNNDDDNQFPFNRIDGKLPGQLNISSKIRNHKESKCASGHARLFQQVQTKNWFSSSHRKMSTKMTKWYSYKRGEKNDMPFHRTDTFQWTAATFKVNRFSKSLSNSFDSKNQVERKNENRRLEKRSPINTNLARIMYHTHNDNVSLFFHP